MAKKPNLPGYQEAWQVGVYYEIANKKLTEIISEAIASGKLADDAYYKEVVDKIYSVLIVTHSHVEPLALQSIRQGWNAGMARAKEILAKAGVIPPPPRKLSGIERRQLAIIEKNIQTEIVNLNVMIGRRIEDSLRTEGLRAARTSVKSLGTTAPGMAELQTRLESAGLTTTTLRGNSMIKVVPVTGKDGIVRNWESSGYARMVVRTNCAAAHSAAQVEECQAYGVDLVQWDDHGTECDLCAELEGEIFSLSGNSAIYEALTDDVDPPIHPNCYHILTPYVE